MIIDQFCFIRDFDAINKLHTKDIIVGKFFIDNRNIGFLIIFKIQGKLLDIIYILYDQAGVAYTREQI